MLIHGVVRLPTLSKSENASGEWLRGLLARAACEHGGGGGSPQRRASLWRAAQRAAVRDSGCRSVEPSRSADTLTWREWLTSLRWWKARWLTVDRRSGNLGLKLAL